MAATGVCDPELELVDPTPDVRALFLAFDEAFFGSILAAAGVEVKWGSPRMTTCAGLCVYNARAGLCSVRLSPALLPMRPRADTVNTLLHEMVHAYLFVTQQNTDHDGHGPAFLAEAARVNAAAGSNITVYHTFHDEVNVHKTHWWRCNGPCSSRPPYHGWVKRAMNRAPGPNDSWWARHAASCGGTFVKVRSPPPKPPKARKKRGEKRKALQAAAAAGCGDLRALLAAPPEPKKQAAEGTGTRKLQAAAAGGEGGDEEVVLVQSPELQGLPAGDDSDDSSVVEVV